MPGAVRSDGRVGDDNDGSSLCDEHPFTMAGIRAYGAIYHNNRSREMMRDCRYRRQRLKRSGHCCQSF